MKVYKAKEEGGGAEEEEGGMDHKENSNPN